MAVKKKAVAKKKGGGKDLVSADTARQRMEELAKNRRANERVADGHVLSARGGKFKYNGEKIGDTVDIVILSVAKINAFYDLSWDPENPPPPACFAVAGNADDEDEMVPHKTSPNKQGDSCETCVRNEWRDDGTGKDCNNRRTIAFIHADDIKNAETVRAADIVTYSVPKTSKKNIVKYITGLEGAMNVMPCAVVTTMDLETLDNNTYVSTLFEMREEITDPSVLMALMDRLDEADKIAEQPVNVSGYAEAKKAAGAAKKPARGKAAASKKTSTKKKATAKKKGRRG